MVRLRSVILGLLLIGTPAVAQTPVPAVPRTSDGHIDLSGHWNTKSLTTMERAAPGPLVVDAEQAGKMAAGLYGFLRSPERGAAQDPNAFAADVGALARVGDEWRTSLITSPADGKLPLTDEGRRRIEAARTATDTINALGPEQRDDFERCLAGTGRTPMFLVPANNHRQIVQTGDFVVIYTEEGGDTRTIRMDGEPLPGVLSSRYGDSIGRWDNDALVVTTTNLRPHASAFPWGVIAVGENSRVVERLSLLSADELRYRFTVEDPTLYSRPWSAEFSLLRSVNETYEYGCHEGNYSIVNILMAARVLEK